MFDSGVGGLTVLEALMAALPDERFVYLGDTARVPYGSKPLEMVRGFAYQIAETLLSLPSKALVIACNTASAAALPQLAEDLDVPVWGVVEPGVEAALSRTASGGTVAVLGTTATVTARVYQDRLEAAGRHVWSKACPLFVPIVEEGISDSQIARLVADHYLSDRPGLDAAILGCTHYPLLKPVLGELFGEGVALIDSSQAVAERVARDLAALGLARVRGDVATGEPAVRVEYLVTGDVGAFVHVGSRLLSPLLSGSGGDAGSGLASSSVRASHIELRGPAGAPLERVVAVASTGRLA